MHSRISVVISRKSITDSATSVYFEVLAISSEHPAHKSGDINPFMLLSYIQLYHHYIIILRQMTNVRLFGKVNK